MYVSLFVPDLMYYQYNMSIIAPVTVCCTVCLTSLSLCSFYHFISPFGCNVILQLMVLSRSYWVNTGSPGSRCNSVLRTRVCSRRGCCSPSTGGRTQRPCCSITWPSTACPCGKACPLLVRTASPASRNMPSPHQASD